MGSHNQQSSCFTSSFSHHSLHTSSSKSRLLFLSSSLLLLFVSLLMLEPPQGAQAAPYSGHGFNIKQRSAIQALRNLDNQYMAQNRPRFGKRFSPGGEQVGASGISYFSEGGAVPLASAESLGASTKPVLSSPGAIIGDKWVLVNRARPLSKAAETIFREMLSDTERYRSSSNGGGAEEVEQK